MATISLCMIVKNEEKFLEGCLQSVQGIVDEIVIVDTGSTDNTVAIAQRYNAKVFSFKWVNDFSAARNESLRHAASDWILYLDADERLSAGQENTLSSLTQNLEVYAYSVLIEGNHYLPTGVVRQQNAYPRLFRRHDAIQFEGVVHEQIIPSLIRFGKIIEPSTLVIEHLGYGQSLEIIKEKCQRNIALLRKQLKQNPKDTYSRFQLGNSFSVLGDYPQARKELEQILFSPQLAPSLRASTLNLLAEFDIRENHNDNAINKLLQSLKLAPSQILARWFLSAAYIGKGSHKEAMTHLHQILTIQEAMHEHKKEDIAHDITIEKPKVMAQLGTCYEGLQNYDEAFHYYVQAFAEDPSLAICKVGIDRIVESLSDYKKAIQQAEMNNVYSYVLYKKGVDYALKSEEYPDALRYIERIIQSNSSEVPERIKLRLQDLQSLLSVQVQS